MTNDGTAGVPFMLLLLVVEEILVFSLFSFSSVITAASIELESFGDEDVVKVGCRFSEDAKLQKQ